MIDDKESLKPAYARHYVEVYRQAWIDRLPRLLRMLRIIKDDATHSTPYMIDGAPRVTYPTFQSYCEAEVEPFVGPLGDLRDEYRQRNNGTIGQSYDAILTAAKSGAWSPDGVDIRYKAMVTDETKAAYSRSYVNEYRRACDRDGAYLFDMLKIIDAEQCYSKFWMMDGVPQPTYETFEEFCKAQVEPFIGPLADLRDRYRPRT